MRRREFITLLGGAAAVWPIVARAQQQQPSPTRIGFLPLGSSSNSSDLLLVEALRDGMHAAGLLEGRDILLDVYGQVMEVSIRRKCLA